MSKVVVMESTYETCQKAVDEAFSHFPIDVRDKKVVVKVNALKPCDPDEYAYVTHHKVLRAVINKIETLNPGQLLVGDSVGTEYYGDSDNIFTSTHLKEAAGPYYRNFNKNLVLIDVDKPFKRKIAVLKDVLEADVYISVPKMKTHGLTIISGGVKNNYGLLAGAQKAWYHYNSVKPEVFARMVVEMYRLRPPDLVIMDAIMAMEGYGPASPETRWVNRILASDDAVAMDTVQAKIVGFNVEDVPYLQIARDMSLGETDLGAIQIIGDASTIQEYHRPTPPAASYSYKAGVGGGSATIEYYRQRVSYRPMIDPGKCRYDQGCRACIEVCPSESLTPGNGLPAKDINKCILCSACREACDYGAIVFLPDEQLMKSFAAKEQTLKNYA